MGGQKLGSVIATTPRTARRNYLMISLNVSSVISNGVCDPKIDQFELTADKDEVCRLEVRVHNLLLVDHMYGLKHLVAT